MKRYYLSPVVGTGVEGDAYRPKIFTHAATVPMAASCVMPSNPDGTPKFNWCLVVAGAADHTTLLADVALAALPQKALDQPLTALERTAITSVLTKFGATADLSGVVTLFDAVKVIGQTLEPVFDAFDVRDVT